MHPTIQAALDHLAAEENRLKQISIDLDEAASRAKDSAEAADDEWRQCRDTLSALRRFAKSESEVQF